jgi:hypothetical protein
VPDLARIRRSKSIVRPISEFQQSISEQQDVVGAGPESADAPREARNIRCERIRPAHPLVELPGVHGVLPESRQLRVQVIGGASKETLAPAYLRQIFCCPSRALRMNAGPGSPRPESATSH